MHKRKNPYRVSSAKGESCSFAPHPLPLPLGEVAAVRLTERAAGRCITLSVTAKDRDSSPKGRAKGASLEKEQYR